MPDYSPLLGLIDEMSAYRRLLEGLRGRDDSLSAVVLDAARPYLIAALHRGLRLPLLLLTAQPENARKLYEQLSAWSGDKVMLLPEPDALPYERITSDAATGWERVKVLAALAGCGSAGGAPLVVASAPALAMKLPGRDSFAAACHTISEGMSIEPFRLLERWQSMGYRLEGMVEVPGSISHRGGVLDIYPPASDLPARLEFFGNTVESIRLFDPASQRSLQAVSSISVSPAAELLTGSQADIEAALGRLDLSGCNAEEGQQLRQDIALLREGQRPRHLPFYAALFNKGSLLEYLPEKSLVVIDEPEGIVQALAELDAEAEEIRQSGLERGELPGNFPRPYFTWEGLIPALESKKRLSLAAWGAADDAPRLDFVSAPAFGGQLAAFLKRAGQLLAQRKSLIIVSHQASRLSELLEGEGIIAAPAAEVLVPPPGALLLAAGSLAEGWMMRDDTCLLTDAEVFGFVKQRRLAKKRPVPRYQISLDLNPDDYVVHVEHGIARFSGVTTLRGAGGEKEYLVLQYAAGDRLYVPTDQIDRVSRYIGAGDRPPSLSRLGTQEWARTRQRAQAAAEELAQELLALYAAREVVPGFAFSPDTLWQQELEAAFPYVETPDQMAAQADVKADMEKARPMDRLVCGDVGYGKTEVAIRAAFKVVMDSRQVAVLVPTTVLAEQHGATFSQRLEAFPVRVEVLSRFRTPKEQRAVLEGLSGGGVDICIGTHRLLQKDVCFKDLGLLIIDEEQRFGVAHKEHLKRMRREVDVLTLSATPIPRTMHMSLVGVRDMSVMETPPEERLPIKTYVSEYSDRLVREAILREMERNGQVFFVHNRVQTIAMVAAGLRALVPEAKIAVAHGQMPESELEAVMADFARGGSDVLVCSTIIESGLDMPSVNTIIVNDADKFGLTQLYQLRGRVGRGANLAYAYFLYKGGKRLTPTAQQRLRTIYEATELGAGFNIAMKDLEIRGAGTLLGAKQSGHITAIGFSLYTRLLAEAVEAQKAKLAGKPEPPPRRPPPAIDLPLAAYLPESYVPDVNTRLELYRDLARLEDLPQLAEAEQGYLDRFGALPPEVKNLLYAVRLKLLAARSGIEAIYSEDGQVVLRRLAGTHFDRKKLAAFDGDGIKIGTRYIHLNPKKLGKKWKEVLEEVVGGNLKLT